MPPGNVDVLTLRAKGKAKTAERAGTVSLQADDPIAALQAIARQAKIKIALTPQEVERLKETRKLPISLSYAGNLAGATGAAKTVVAQAVAAPAGDTGNAFPRMLALFGLSLILAALVFYLTYRLLEKVYG